MSERTRTKRTCVFDLEEWRDVVDIPDRVPLSDRYEVSSLGNIRSKSFLKTGKNKHGEFSFWTKPKQIKQRLSSKGYKVIDLSREWRGSKVKMHIQVHRIVAEAFLGIPKLGEQVNHKDGIKIHNDVINLEWVTCKENIQHSYRACLASNANTDHPASGS